MLLLLLHVCLIGRFLTSVRFSPHTVEILVCDHRACATNSVDGDKVGKMLQVSLNDLVISRFRCQSQGEACRTETEHHDDTNDQSAH